MASSPRNHRQLTPGGSSFGELSFIVLAAKSQDFDQVPIEESVESLARVPRTQLHSIDFTQNPPNIRPNIPGAGAGAGDGRVGGAAVIVPLDRKAAGGFWDTLDGGRPAFLSRTTPGIGN